MLRANARHAVAGALAAVLVLPAGAAAQDVPAPTQPTPAQPTPAQKAPDYAAAKQAYQAAEAAIARGDFAAAARDYGIAFQITGDPVLFFKLGSSFKRAGDCATAVVYFQRYLKEAAPDQAFQLRTRTEIAECEVATGIPAPNPVALPPPAAGTAPAGQPATAPPSYLGTSSWQRTAAWASVGVTIALLTTGTVLGLSARSREEDIDNLIDFRDPAGEPARFAGATRERYEDLVAEGKSFERWSIISLSAAGVGAAASVLFFVLDDAHQREASRAGLEIVPAVGRDGAAVRAGWSF